ncbi:MAG TPA: glycosyltransferase [Cyclobacteriaceae bacterium]|nr:glycosyltransferase [Cyclobacteriaceae bacterium]
MHIIFNPPVNEENKYIDILVTALRKGGYVVHPLKVLLSSKQLFDSIHLVHLNWFENVDDSSYQSALKSFFRKMFVLSVIRISGKKLVWTMHNRSSHEKRTGWISRTITRYLIKWSHKIVIHSHQSRAIMAKEYPEALEKLCYIPHPDFIDIYGPVQKSSRLSSAGPLKLLFVGAVKPYKNIELLIQVAAKFEDRIEVTIAGKPNTPSYGDRIKKLADSAGNVQLVPRFIPNEELPRFMAETDLLVLPYDLKSSLNSGTVILAFSYKKTVICPLIGTIEDMGEGKANVFHYSYQTDEEHADQLADQIDKAIKYKKQLPNSFNELGETVFQHISRANSKEQVTFQLLSLYQSLLS